MVKDCPLPEVVSQCRKLIADGGIIFQKWTCGKCGARVQANTPNQITEKGHHEECGHISDLTKTGCGFILAMPLDKIVKHLPT